MKIEIDISEIAKNFAESMKERRIAAKPKITLDEISEASGVSKGAIFNIESGATANPGAMTLDRLDKALTNLEERRAKSNG